MTRNLPTDPPPSTPHPNGIIGIDFSAAANNGDTLWISQGAIYQNTCHISQCQSARQYFGATKRSTVFVALRNWLVAQPPALVGVDVAFSVPKPFISEANWEKFLTAFCKQYDTAEAFRTDFQELAACAGENSRQELKRQTDREAKTPFSPYNLRMYKQTFYWLNDVLYPLVAEQLICVLPMMKATPKRPWVLETCPASYLKLRGLYQPYKGKTPAHKKQRTTILKALQTEKHFALKDKALADVVIENSGGDALDSVLCAWITFQNRHHCTQINDTAHKTDYALEGYVFV